ncbi:MAG TPA: phosphoribosyltransferase [Persephonella sp.]|uniref:Phosphoribosyltransferase n=1 Tax=Persephonella marina (strain DSM 14350 / EX-H1) TaxID=123214 RepID=C0QSZ9_PERMH|nr:phosphoribosyltransferase family protein [Persephonella sp.]ACO03824.1 phosphoribosyltransferase [Persephonella marina EX-H1]HCB70567.1 phosphoribosyltransferase [Persephonella sp.]
MGRFYEDKSLRDKEFVFENRDEAGEKLAEFLKDIIDKNSIVLAIPSGGVPIGIKISEKLKIPFDLIPVKKLTFPWNPEAGFGAVTVEGDTFINEEAVRMTGITEDIIKKQKEKTINVLRERNRKFRENRPFPDLKGKTVIIVDDGLASGYTMLAAISMVKRKKPEKIIVAVPTCSKSSVDRIISESDAVVCLNYRTGYPYAVADAYKEWYDLTDQDVLYYLKKEEKDA